MANLSFYSTFFHDYPQQFCQTQSNAEIEKLLQGIKRRLALLNSPEPEVVVADNCCHVRKAIKNAFPDTHIGLDVWHMLMRYVLHCAPCANLIFLY